MVALPGYVEDGVANPTRLVGSICKNLNICNPG